MSPTLNALWQDALSKSRLTASKDVREKIRSYENQIQETLGPGFLDGFTAAYDTEAWEQIEKAYELGFVTAFHLCMEVFAEYPPQ